MIISRIVVQYRCANSQSGVFHGDDWREDHHGCVVDRRDRDRYVHRIASTCLIADDDANIVGSNVVRVRVVGDANIARAIDGRGCNTVCRR